MSPINSNILYPLYKIMKEQLIDVCKTLGWTALGCVSLYIIIAFVFLVLFTVLGFFGAIGLAVSGGDTVADTQSGV